MKSKRYIQSFNEHQENLNISDVSDSNLIFNIDKKYTVIKVKEESQISFYVFDNNNLPELENVEKYNDESIYFSGNKYLDKKKIAKANVYINKSLHDMGYQMVRNKKDYLDLKKNVVHLNNIEVDEKYRGRDIGRKLIRIIMDNLNTDVIYLQPDSKKSYQYWINIGCKDTGYNYLDYKDTPLLELFKD